jgi:short subunit dehydrogenase-like uncharacterized protein
VEEIVNVLNSSNSKVRPLSWAVAGRSEKKLTDTLKQVSALTGEDLQNVDKVISDISDIVALRKMAAQCTVLLNAAGPYAFYGESVVQACLAESTSQVDIAGELQYLEKMQVLYDSEANDKHVYIIGACGIDSVPADCGVMYLRKNFDGDINSVESYRVLEKVDPKVPYRANIGSWNATVNFLRSFREMRRWRRKLYTRPLPNPKYQASARWPLHFSREVDGWCVVFTGPDTDVVRRSQYRLFTEENRQPIQYHAYFKIPSIFLCLGVALFGLVVLMLSQFKYGLYLLHKYAQVFTLGLISHNGPTREESENVLFSFHMTASGWSKDPHGNRVGQHRGEPNKKMKLVVSGVNPAYRATAAMLLQSGLTVLREQDRMPQKGGVYTPGVAFANTTLIERLHSRGVEFHIGDAGKED